MRRIPSRSLRESQNGTRSTMTLRIDSLQSHFRSFLEPAASAASSLFEQELVLSEPSMTITTDRDFLAGSSEGFLITQIEISGDSQGKIALIVPVSNAVRISGKQDEVEDEAPSDTSSRIGNLHEREKENVQAFLGSLIQAFTDHLASLYSVTLSFFMEEPLVLESPGSASELFASSHDRLLQLSLPMSLGEEELGPVHVLVPESLIDLSILEQHKNASGGGSEGTPSVNLTQEELQEILDASQEDGSEQEEERPESAADPSGSENAGDASEGDDGTARKSDDEARAAEDDSGEEEDEEEHEGVDPKTLRKTLERAVQNGEEELGDLLGKSLELTEDTFTVKNKEEIFTEHQDKLILTKLLAKGDSPGEIYSLISTRDAIVLGGTLLMIPEEEINKKIKQDNFSDDEADAFGEIINIWTGALSKVFETYYPHKLHIKKDRMINVIPTKVQKDSSDPFPDGEYLVVSYKMQFGTRALGNLEMIFPLPVLDISRKRKEEIREQKGMEETGEPQEVTPAIAVLSEHREENKKISSLLQSMGFELCYLSFRENIKEKIRSYNVATVLIILQEVNEKSLAKLIKVQSLLRNRYPTVVAGPKWTRSQVIQAIKYGAEDIISTPADEEIIRQKFGEYLPEQQAIT